MRGFLIGLAAALLLAAPGCSRAAEEVLLSDDGYGEGDAAYDLSGITETYTLTVQTHEPAYAVSGEFLESWAVSIEEASGGRLELDISYSGKLGGAGDTAYMVKNGVVDIGWGLQYAYEGWFPVTEAFSLPGLGIGNAEEGSTALWGLWETTDYLDAEYEDYHVLLLYTGCRTAAVLSGEKAEGVQDLRGKTAAIGPDVLTEYIQDLGMLPMDVTDGILYEDLEGQAVDMAIKAWDMAGFLGLDPAVSWYLDEDFGVYTYFILMNQDSYEALPEELQRLLDDKSAEAISTVYLWDDAETEARAAAGNKVYRFTDGERADLEEAAAQARLEWAAAMDGAGYDGEGILEAIRDLLTQG